MGKVYFVKKYHRGKYIVIKGTMEGFIHRYFGYTLECGHSWNSKINPEPKTYKSLISNLNKSYHETQGNCFDPDYVEEATEEEYVNAEKYGFITNEAL